MFRFLLATLAIAAPALAAQQVALQSDVQVERVQVVGGRQTTVLQPPRSVVPGDKLVFRTQYKNTGAAAATRFVVTNPVPAAVAWTGEATGGVEASVDGGRMYGPLASLRVKGANGQFRAATPADVTHLRWTVATIAPTAGGQILYRGVVR